uniref:Uncharacterized protein n=1 Tax=Solibacter usitatus (strain Ellin6076) TaxID=234267 RepID=Q01X13_SOLUE
MRILSVGVFTLLSIAVAAAQPESPVAGDVAPVVSPSRPVQAHPESKHAGGIHWGPLLEQWWLNLVMDHSVRILKEPKTREQLSGPFFKGWINTVSMYRFDRWDDDDKFVTSYLGHPTQGAIAAAIFWQNNDHVRFSDQDFHSAAYRKALLQTFAFVTFDAVQWKLGPLSEASIGHVGFPAHWWDRDCKELHIPCKPRTGMNDLVLNEVGGTAMAIGYQWLDKHVQKRIEAHVQSRALIDTTRVLMNPPQAVANIVRFRAPWFRDSRR